MAPTNTPPVLSIGIYFFDLDERGFTSMQQLQATSDYLTRMQIIPIPGDWVSILTDDWPVLGIDKIGDSARSKSIMIVESRIISFGLIDVAIICNFKEWTGDAAPAPGWQQVPLN